MEIIKTIKVIGSTISNDLEQFVENNNCSFKWRSAHLTADNRFSFFNINFYDTATVAMFRIIFADDYDKYIDEDMPDNTRE